MTEQKIIREFEDGYMIRVNLKRGSGTRDQDSLTGEVHGETLEKAIERSDRMLEQLDSMAERTRAIQYGESDE